MIDYCKAFGHFLFNRDVWFNSYTCIRKEVCWNCGKEILKLENENAAPIGIPGSADKPAYNFE